MKTPRLSKPNISESDCALARHYGLRPAGEELNFIINYDVKYRMGADTQEDDE